MNARERVRVASRAPEGGPSYLNLAPIVEMLAAAGNTPWADFHPTKTGWTCLLRDPIDFQLVRARFELPANITLSEEYDTVGDNATYNTIRGRKSWIRPLEKYFTTYAEQAENSPGRAFVPPRSPHPTQRFFHLAPLVGSLIRAGNELGDCTWFRPHNGTDCGMTQPIDFELLALVFDFPPTILLDREHDQIVDTESGYVIHGPTTT